MGLTCLTQARRSVKRWKSPLWCMCAGFLRSRGNSRREEISSNPGPDIGLGLATGTRLRARLESAASTAVRTPVLAVIEYNYERDGEILVPAGARVIGHMQDADRSGYVRIEFDSLMMPDGAAMPIQAVATDLEMRPLKGKVEGKNTGKNVLSGRCRGSARLGPRWSDVAI